MPFSFHLDPEERLLLITVTGAVEGPEVLEAVHTMLAHLAEAPHVDRIWDAQPTLKVAMGPEHLAALQKLLREHAGLMRQGRAALVVPDAVLRSIAHLLRLDSRQLQGNGGWIEVFETMREARIWLQRRGSRPS